jgi:transcriptional regulator with XRE-family HTH domain
MEDGDDLKVIRPLLPDHQYAVNAPASRAAQGLDGRTRGLSAPCATEAISNLERAVSLPGFDTLKAIANALNTPPDVFFLKHQRAKSAKTERT